MYVQYLLSGKYPLNGPVIVLSPNLAIQPSLNCSRVLTHSCSEGVCFQDVFLWRNPFDSPRAPLFPCSWCNGFAESMGRVLLNQPFACYELRRAHRKGGSIYYIPIAIPARMLGKTGLGTTVIWSTSHRLSERPSTLYEVNINVMSSFRYLAMAKSPPTSSVIIQSPSKFGH